MTAAAPGQRLEGPARTFEALGDATRLGLVARLCEAGPLSIVQLTAGTAISRQGVTKHLEVLARARVVRDSRRGRERVWEVDPRQLEVARRYLDQASRRWDEAIDRLRLLVEGDPP